MPTEPMLDITEILADTGFDRSSLTRFLAEPAIKKWLGGEATHPRYPLESLEQFRAMYAAKSRGIKPKAWAIAVADVPNGSSPASFGDAADQSPVLATNPETGIAPYDASALTSAAELVGGRFADVVIERLQRSQMLPPVEDRLLSREQAAEYLACLPAQVGRRVPPVRPGRWSYLDIQTYIAGLRQAAHDKPRKTRKAKSASLESQG